MLLSMMLQSGVDKNSDCCHQSSTRLPQEIALEICCGVSTLLSSEAEDSAY